MKPYNNIPGMLKRLGGSFSAISGYSQGKSELGVRVLHVSSP